jgi:uncharacterized protein YjbI with pentapeptide repeats
MEETNGKTFEGETFEDKLNNSKFTQCNFKVCNFRGNINNTIFTSCFFFQLNIKDITISNVQFTNIRFGMTTFTRVRFENVTFNTDMCNFTDCTFNNVNLEESVFSGDKLNSIDFTQGIIKPLRITLNASELTNCNLSGIDLSNVKITRYTKFNDTNLSGCIFKTGIDFTEFTFNNTNFSGCNLSGANFSKTRLNDVDFTSSNIRGTNFSQAIINHVKLADGEYSSTVYDLIRLGGIVNNEVLLNRGFSRIQVFNPDEPQFLTARLDPIKRNEDELLNEITKCLIDIRNRSKIIFSLCILRVKKLSHTSYTVDILNDNTTNEILYGLTNAERHYDINLINLLKQKYVRELHALNLLNIGEVFIIPCEYYFSRNLIGFHIDIIITKKYILDQTYVSLTYLLPEDVKLPGPEIMLNPIYPSVNIFTVYRFSVVNYSTVYFNNKLLIHSTPHPELEFDESETFDSGFKEIHTMSRSSILYPPREEGRKALLDNTGVSRDFLRSYFLKPEDHNFPELNNDENYEQPTIILIEEHDIDVSILANTGDISDVMEGHHFGGEFSNTMSRKNRLLSRKTKTTRLQYQIPHLKKYSRVLKPSRKTKKQTYTRKLSRINKNKYKFINIKDNKNFCIMSKRGIKYKII